MAVPGHCEGLTVLDRIHDLLGSHPQISLGDLGLTTHRTKRRTGCYSVLYSELAQSPVEDVGRHTAYRMHVEAVRCDPPVGDREDDDAAREVRTAVLLRALLLPLHPDRVCVARSTHDLCGD